jgi:hypothetical protein
VTDEVADWSGDGVVNDIAARVDRAGPRPVSEDHKPDLLHPDVDWLINYFASISKRGSLGDVIIRHVREVNYLVNALRYRGRGPVSLVARLKGSK